MEKNKTLFNKMLVIFCSSLLFLLISGITYDKYFKIYKYKYSLYNNIDNLVIDNNSIATVKSSNKFYFNSKFNYLSTRKDTVIIVDNGNYLIQFWDYSETECGDLYRKILWNEEVFYLDSTKELDKKIILKIKEKIKIYE